ncbi:hypothetical protein L1047_06040 [Synechococcus sp. Nb3U1]|uniref:hypothetical protein n=1 Tax=Synechococcus sp. Nb3U1 TaxID=1914529 RepID=UPI001F28E894|nr:hypothetical protein [Synechococcus sp. Nb3U1]MCF2970755.1 hypothetical protein [Synechococcus sp. Nb3U1]
MSPVLLKAIGYACGISLGILALAGLVNFLVNLFIRRLGQQSQSESFEDQSSPDGATEGSQSV